ncbi:alpha-hydroxy acid oxidase [Variovorax sp. OV084]|uniref:alpha-hydroxy acid oxidase n=1 Tax=Variovorax sp. OV084 TaxID=1882777 RepID=UPI0008B56199|nr:alpha-hydroxy acid oxidase [Variovorax sp. OV084]SEU20743.1 (S)-mandelate dehydrogenase [Variovorax sp. OV084]
MLLNIEDYRRRARSVLPRFVYDYIEGSADDGHCMRRNAEDLSSIELTPRVLRDTTQVDTSVEVFGRKWALPFGIAPTGLNGLVRPEGDRLLASAAAGAGIPFSLSTASNMRLEDVRAAASGGMQWMQLYVMHREMASQIVERAQKDDYQALVLTVDVPVSGNRELDLRNGFRMPFRPTPRLAWDLVSHPRWSLRMAPRGAPDFANLTSSGSGAGSTSMQAALLARAMDRSLVWESLAWLRGLWKGPLLLKGVLHADDARMALDHGIDGLIVSNHGGRQNDASPSAISALPRVVRAVDGRIPVFMDGGIRRGGDVAKALALGATAVFVGRPTLYGLAAGGQQGAAAVLKILADELVRSMTLLGASTVRDLSGSPGGR